MKSFITVLIMILSASCLLASTIYVPNDYTTIQAGLNAATEGDTVLVAAGTYTGDGNRDLTFNGVNLVLKSESGADVTIIDCQADSLNYHTGVTLNNGEDSMSVIDGFTFTNAYYNQYGYLGGALFFLGGTANVQNCVIHNSALNGIFIYTQDSIYACRISNCIIENNVNGLHNGVNNVLIENCIVRDNDYTGIEFFRSTEIRNCLVVHNSGIGVAHSVSINLPPVLIDHCTIAFNGMGFVYDITPPKAGSELIEVDTGTVRNSIIAYNTNGGIYNYFAEDAPYNCIYSNVVGNGNYNWQNDKYSHGDIYGNISLTPLFCDTTVGNYYLGENSPCVASHNSSGSTIGVYDIGCGCCVGIRGNWDGDPNDEIDIGDIVYLVTHMFSFGDPIACDEEGDVDISGGLDIADLVYMVTYMFGGGPEPLPCY